MKLIFKLTSIIYICTTFLCYGCNYNKNQDNKTHNNEDTIQAPSSSIDFPNLTYVVFGDSITYGADYSNGYRQMETPYDEEVKNILNLKESINMGVSGATFTRNNIGLVSMSDVIVSYDEPADIISVMGGVNDFNRDLPLGKIEDKTIDTIYGALHVTMSYLKENYPKAYIFYMTPYKEDYSGRYWEDINSQGYNLKDVADAIKEVALLYNIDVLDMFELGEFESVMYNSDCDGIHPNQDFILEKTAPQIADFLKKNYK